MLKINGEDTSVISPTLGFNIKTITYQKYGFSAFFLFFFPLICIQLSCFNNVLIPIYSCYSFNCNLHVQDVLCQAIFMWLVESFRLFYSLKLELFRLNILLILTFWIFFEGLGLLLINQLYFYPETVGISYMNPLCTHW